MERLSKIRDLSNDRFFDGQIQIRQYRKGYRFSIDAVILAHYIDPPDYACILDLGTGCGIIPILIAFRNPSITCYAVEIQSVLADLATLNAKSNHLQRQITTFCMDMKSLHLQMFNQPVDIIVSNPPYRSMNSGRINPNDQRAVARHELKINLKDLVSTARRLLQQSGKFIVMYTADRFAEVMEQMRSGGLEPKRLRMIHSHRESEAKMVIVEGVKGGRPGTKISPPLIIYRKNGNYTDEIAAMLTP